jgi:DNA polymerase-3 subunit alpha
VERVRRRAPEFDLKAIPEDDKNVYDMLTAGKTSGVFQMESSGMTGVCVRLRPQSIEDITAIIALYRPGPMESIPRFIDCKQHPERIRYKHPLLESILSVTYGCIVYQEQVIEIFRKLAGFSLGQADLIRRAMSKKKQKEIVKERKTFVEGDPDRGICGAVANGVPAQVAEDIYDEILAFANYAFNKAHAVSYAIIAYQTAYLKYYYPSEYMAALLSSVSDVSAKIAEYIADCRASGIPVLPPDINGSDDGFTVGPDGSIRFGLAAVKGIGRGFIRSVMAKREAEGPFTSFQDFCRRMTGTELNKREAECLIKAGAFDTLGANRKQLLQASGQIMDGIQAEQRGNLEGQFNLFEEAGEEHRDFPLPQVEEFSAAERMRMEREVTGLYLSGHPMDDHREAARRMGAVTIASVLASFEEGDGNFRDGQTVTIAGVISAIKTKTTKNNSLMAYVTLEDNGGSMELLVFQRLLDEWNGVLAEGMPILARGRISVRDEKAPQLMAERFRRFDEESEEKEAPAKTAGAEKPKTKTLWTQFPSQDCPEYRRLQLILIMFPGQEPIKAFFRDTRKTLTAPCWIHPSLVRELKEMLGEENVVVK